MRRARNAVVATVVAIIAIAVVGAVAATYDAPTSRIGTDERTTVDAPFTKVQDDDGGTRVRSPFVDVEVPKDRDE
jgi:ABC-type transporter Mla subunit MlaD